MFRDKKKDLSEIKVFLGELKHHCYLEGFRKGELSLKSKAEAEKVESKILDILRNNGFNI